MKLKNKKKDLRAEQLRSSRRFAIVCIVVAFSVLAASGIYSHYYGSDTSIDLQGVEASVLIKDHSPKLGSQSAPVTIVEFLDPECESCRAMHYVMKQLKAHFKDDIKIVIRYLPNHGNSRLAASGLEEAREIGKYEEAMEIFFDRQPEWGSHHNPRPELLAGYLKEVGVDPGKTTDEYLLAKHKWKIDIDQKDAQEIGVQKTPTFFVNGRILRQIGYDPLKQAIDFALSNSRR